ncbi:MAG TPA: glutathione S-transferase family protein [Polyangiaceae bacterium]|nr:glutathione S-transferase family protein [Polyangiaceae bacterium]
MSRTLVALAVSPWSEKARWALDHHHLGYRTVEHLPGMYEPALRFLSKKPLEKVTVPMLFDEGEVFRSSTEIAQHADAIGQGDKLFARAGEVLALDELAERFMFTARARLLPRLMDDRDALYESLPPVMQMASPITVPIARRITGYLVTKYGQEASAAESESTMTGILDHVETLVAKGDYLVGGAFSFADIAIACALGFVRPHERATLGPANRRIFTDERLAAAYPGLLAWRDRIVLRHR